MAPGMQALLMNAGLSPHIDVIIISDSNDLFIKWILEAKRLLPVVNKVCA